MMRRRTIWIIGVVLLIGALAAAAILYRDSIGREIVNSALQETGYSVASLSVESLSKDVVRLAELSIDSEDGTRIIVRGVTLPVNLRERRIDSLEVEFVELIPSETGAEAASLADLVQTGLSAHKLVPDIAVSAGILRVPWLPDMSQVEWQTTLDGQSIRFDIDEFRVEAGTLATGPGHDLAVTVSTADEDNVLSWSGAVKPQDPGLLLAGEAEAVVAHWIPVLRALGALPEGLREIDAQVYGNVSALVSGDYVQLGGTLWSDDDVDVGYVTEDGDDYAISAAGFDALEWQLGWPSLDWTASLDSLQPSVSTGAASIELQLDDINCRAGIDCGFDTEFLARDMTTAELSLGMISVSAAVVVKIRDTLTAQSTRPATISLGRIRYGDWMLDAIDLEGAFELADTDISASMEFRAGEGIAGEFKASYDQQRGDGRLSDVSASIDFGRENASDVFDGWPYAWDILAGTLSATANLQISGKDSASVVAGEVDIALDSLAGSFGDLAFAGLELAATASVGATAGLEVSPFDAEVALFDPGFPVEKISARVSPDLASGEIAVDDARMQALGGHVFVDPFTYSLTAKTSQLIVRPRGIQLQLIVDLVDSEALTVEGSVSGAIPVNISGHGITAEGGRVESDPPGGAIRFPSGIPGLSGGDDSSQVGVVTQALSNFEFESLTSDVTYTVDGDLLLQMRMQGANPDMDPDQPVVLNLGLENNVPQLLKSLQAARSISDILEHRFAN